MGCFKPNFKPMLLNFGRLKMCDFNSENSPSSRFKNLKRIWSEVEDGTYQAPGKVWTFLVRNKEKATFPHILNGFQSHSSGIQSVVIPLPISLWSKKFPDFRSAPSYLSSHALWWLQWHRSSHSGWRHCAQTPASPASPEPSQLSLPQSLHWAGSP